MDQRNVEKIVRHIDRFLLVIGPPALPWPDRYQNHPLGQPETTEGTRQNPKKTYASIQRENKKTARLQSMSIKSTIDSLQRAHDGEDELRQAILEMEQNVNTTPEQSTALSYLNQTNKAPNKNISRKDIENHLSRERENQLLARSETDIKNLYRDDLSLADDAEGFNWLDAPQDSSSQSMGERMDKRIDDLAATSEEYKSLKQAEPAPFPIADHPLSQARQAGMKHLQKDDAKVMEAIQALDKYKSKYRLITNSADLADKKSGTAEKINSLKGEPFVKRIKWSGQFHVELGKPLLVDFNPGIAYRFNKDWSLGIGGTIRGQLTGKNVDDAAFPIKGIRTFTEYRTWRSFYVHAEHEYLTRKIPRTESAIGASAKTGQSINIGVGKTFALYKGLKGNTVILYNIDLNGSGFYKSPWVVRVGVGN
jgi:hypothetical protein